jgi:amino acid adenylation domain-containing protein
MQRQAEPPEYGPGIAIVGMSCILPGGIDTPAALWTFLCEGRDAISEVPPGRWNNDAVYDPDPGTAGKTSTRWGGFVCDIAEFDAGFFGISPREAAVMDPQQRLLLEAAWRALEDAGIPVDELAGSRTGVYVGISHSDYHGIQQFGRHDIDVHTSTGGALSIAANRLSHRLDLRGPSLAIDTACSSSLVALDAACNALRSGECHTALVGGVNAILMPDVTITFSRASMLSPDGRCKAFDARANGYVRAEGAGIVVLKPLDRARADGDRIHAVIRATVVNQDGRTTTITVPSLDAQVAMLSEACRRGGIDPGHITYVEAHGTGTAVGDPIEANAIGTVFGAGRRRPCLIGSIKTNIGHLEPAAGIAGLIKSTLCVEHGTIPPSLHFQTPNPNIRFAELGIEVARRLRPFPTGKPRIVAVNSFGFGGTNACAIVAEAGHSRRRAGRPKGDGWPVLLPVSAASRTGLTTIATQLASQLEAGTLLADMAGSLAVRRSHLDHRAVIWARSRREAVTRLRSLAQPEVANGMASGRRAANPRLAFVFTGQGAHWWAMGRGLLTRDRVFREAVENCERIFRRLADWSLIAELTAPRRKSRIDHTVVTQPTTFALQVGLAARWKAWGLEPEAVIGHSIGEMAAAYVSGALTLEDAIAVVHHRSRLQEHARLQGGMAALGLGPDEAQRIIGERQLSLEIAAVNAPELVTVAGPRTELDEFISWLQATRSGVLCQLLRVDYAFHSRQMDPFERELRESLTDLRPKAPTIAMFSTVTGTAVRAGELSADYWWRNMRQAVLFGAAIDTAIEAGFDTFLELGPHPALAAPIRHCLAHRGREGTTIASLRRQEADQDIMAAGLAQLYVRGVRLDWRKIVPPGWSFVDLPKQPFEKSAHWAESEEARSARFDGPVHPLLGYRVKTAAPRWQAHIGAESPRFLSDHRVDGSVVFPASGYVELALAAAREVLPEAPYEIESMAFHDALVLAPQAVAIIETSIDPEQGTIKVASRIRGGSDTWNLQASGRVRPWPAKAPALNRWEPKIAPPAHLKRARFYRQLAREGHEFGPAFQGVETLWHERGHALAMVDLPQAAGHQADFLLHPALLDACFQAIRGLRGFEPETTIAMGLPVSIERFRFFRSPSGPVFSRVDAVADLPAAITCNISIIDTAGEVVALIDGFHCRRVAQSQDRPGTVGTALYRERWIELAAPDGSEAAAAVEQGGTWLVLADECGVAEELASRLDRLGQRAVLVFAGAELGERGPDRFEARIGVEELKHDLQQIIRKLGRGPVGAVHLWALDTLAAPVSASSIRSAQETTAKALVGLIQALADLPSRPRLVVATAGLARVGDAPPATSVAQASVVGALRSIANELPDLRPVLIDLDPARPAAEALMAELFTTDGETEVALRAGSRHGCRLEQTAKAAIPYRRKRWDAATRFPACRLTMTAPGVIDNLVVREIVRPTPKPGEVLVEVHAAGLNFRDVMAATNLLPAEAEDEPAWQHLGFECAGIVRAVGDGVDAGLIGRRVVGIARGSFASEVCVPAALIFDIPDTLSLEAAAAIPTAYATAQHALVTLGRMAPGESILIHAATGGVGLAAVNVARGHGAQVLATAGSPDKRAYLAKLGVEHVFDSRSLDFADHVMSATSGRGVDLVLNSLPGPFLEKSLAVLAPGGRFLEIGKRDIYANSPIGLHALRRNAAFFAVDLARLASERPDRLREELKTVFDDLASGRLEQLPVLSFPIAKAADAFRFMATAKHIGKIVLTCAQDELDVEASGDPQQIIRGDASYLVTGGLGGFGLAIARWLVAHGARSLALVGRTGAVRPQAADAIGQMRESGVGVAVIAADVADPEGVAAALEEVRRSGKPLRGIIHAAGVIEDALAHDLDGARIDRVFDAKVLGAWHLHEQTRGTPLDFFVCLSSVAAVLGSVGQAHYAGANAALDAISELRRRDGLPCLSIAWGAIAGVGHLSRRPDIARYLDQIGITAIPVEEALEELGSLLACDCSSFAVAKLNWPRLARANPGLATRPRTAGLAATEAADLDAGRLLRSKLLSASPAERSAMVATVLRDQVAAVLKVPSSSVELDRPLAELGLDSLTSFELKNRVEGEFGLALPIGSFLQRPKVRDIASAIIERLDAAPIDSGHSRETSASEPPMSIGQEALWFVDRVDPGSPAYGLAICIDVRPRINFEWLDSAFRLVVSRHESLRLSFPSDGVGPLPSFVDLDAFQVVRVDATRWTKSELRAELDRLANTQFDLGKGPLVRFYVFRRAYSDVFLLHVHHIVADAASIAILLEEMFAAYFAMKAGDPVRWVRPMRPFSTHVAWQNRVVEGPEGVAHRAFWREQLAGAPTALNLPADFPRPPTQRGAGSSINFVLSASLGRRIKRFAQREGTTLFAVLLAAVNLLLHRYGGDSDIVVGTPAGGRVRAGSEDIVGYLVNPVPIRTRLRGGQTLRELLADVDSTVRSVLEHQEYPFVRIVHELDVIRDASRPQIFQVMFAMERSASVDSHGFAVTLLNTEGAAFHLREFTIRALAVRRDRALFDLNFVVEEFNDYIHGVVDYRSDLWRAQSVERLVKWYEAILRDMLAAPQRLLSEIRLHGAEARLEGPRLDGVPDLVQAIRDAAASDPARIAIEAADGQWTYASLVERWERVADGLAARAIGPGDLVAVCLPRSRDLVAAMIGVLDAGAAYVPIDRTHPEARVAQIIVDASPALIITDGLSAEFLPESDCPQMSLDTLIAERAPSVERQRGELAYVIHTSGSTGRPVGVEVGRAALSNLLAAMRHGLPITAADVLLAVTTVSFDIAGLELLLPLTLGGRVVLADDDTARDAQRLAARLARGDISIMQATPATWQMLIDVGWRGSRDLKAWSGGERLPRSLADALFARVGGLWNLYGPTETTIWSTFARVEPGQQPVSIGRPVANTVCYVVDERLQHVPSGAPGELLIAGQGLARGYRNDPQRTAERFIPDPFDGSRRCFRTGDFVRVGEDGNLIYIGRRDQQVKVRGFRIELEEIEAALNGHPAVRAAVAAKHGQDVATARIVAYVAKDANSTVTDRELIVRMQQVLPAYAVPSSIIVLDELPRLPNGKIDRAGLAKLSARPHEEEAADDRPNAIEEKLIAILSDVLGTGDVRIDDDFFALGGTSLLGMRYLVRAREVLGVDLGPSDLIRAPTVRGLAQRIAAAAAAGPPRLPGPVANRSGHETQALWRPLPVARAERTIGAIDAAAIAYLPDTALAPMQSHLARAALNGFAAEPYWTGACRTELGTTALVVAPLSGQELFDDRTAITPVLDRAVAHAARLGARSISLTGLIPAATDLGRSLSAPDGTGLTTGHAATACAMGLNIQAAAMMAARDLSGEVICFVGLGAIGTATLRTILDRLTQPAGLILCDVPAKRVHLDGLAEEARRLFGFRGPIEILTSGGRLPDRAYRARVIVGASNATDVIDVDRLRPGTVMIDDSFPLCFDLDRAVERSRRQGDILFAAGGSVRPRLPIEWTLALPPELLALARDSGARALLPSSEDITGCILASLLPVVTDLRPTLGTVTVEECRETWQVFARLGIGAAELHCGQWAPTPDEVARFRANHNGQDAAAAS